MDSKYDIRSETLGRCGVPTLCASCPLQDRHRGIEVVFDDFQEEGCLPAPSLQLLVYSSSDGDPDVVVRFNDNGKVAEVSVDRAIPVLWSDERSPWLDRRDVPGPRSLKQAVQLMLDYHDNKTGDEVDLARVIGGLRWALSSTGAGRQGHGG